MKISVIMPSYLGSYENCADKREERFVYSVNSFINQKFEDCELCIVSDGCDKTEEIYLNKFSKIKNIKFKKIKKTKTFSGETRNIGIEMAEGFFVCFLDSDDFIGEYHLKTIIEQIEGKDLDWAYFDDYIYIGNNCFKRRSTKTKDGQSRLTIGTSSIIYKRSLPVKWSDGYGHDHVLIREMIKKYKYEKLKKIPQYFICHVPVPGPLFDIDNPSFSYSS